MAQELPYEQQSFQAVHAEGTAQGVRTPWANQVAHAYDASIQALDKGIAEMVALEDYSLQQKAEHDFNSVYVAAQQQLNDRMNLPDGDENSFYDENGTLRQNKVQDFLSGFQKNLTGIASSGIRPETLEKNEWMSRDMFLKMSGTVIQAGKDKQLKNALTNFENNYKLAIEQNRINDAIAIASGAADAGLIPKSQADLLGFEAQKKWTEDNLNYLIDTDPDAAAKGIANGDYNNILSPAELGAAIKAIRRNRESKARESAQAMTNSGTPQFQAMMKGETYDELSRVLNNGNFTALEKNLMLKKASGQDIEYELKTAARNAALAFNPNADMAEQKDEFFKKFMFLGLKEEYLNGLWKQAEEKRKEIMGSDIPVERILDASNWKGSLLNNIKKAQITWAYYDNNGNISDEKIKEIRANKDLLIRIGATPRSLPAEIRDKMYTTFYTQISTETREDIITEFNNWRTTNGKEASQVEQYNKLNEITKRITDRTLEPYEKAELEDKRTEELRKAQKDLHEKKLDVEGDFSFPLIVGNRHRLVRLGVDNDPGKEAGILIPESWAEQGINMGEAFAEVTDEKGRGNMLRIVGFTQGNFPVYTQAAVDEYRLNMDTNKPYTVQILGGNWAKNTAEGQRQFLQQDASTSADMIDAIIENEGRFDKNKNLMIYDTPSADGSGNEVAGINQKYHPEEYAKLENLVRLGMHKEAREEAKRYIKEYTQPAQALMAQAGIRDRGIEYVLRDMAFNHGIEGMRRVLRRALNLDKGAGEQEIIEGMKAWPQQGSPIDILLLLKNARGSYYADIGRANPAKGKNFGGGWRNRNNKVTNTAQQYSAGLWT